MKPEADQERSRHHPDVSIAVDLGGTKIAAARISGQKVVAREQAATDGYASPERHLATIVDLVERLRQEPDTNLGVAVCGRVDNKGNWYALNDRTLSGFSSFPLKSRLESHFGNPVNVMNDATAAAWGEYRACKGDEDVDSLLYVTVSTGVGGGLVLNGNPLETPDGLASHIGFMTSSFGGLRCGSGRFATLESVASGTAIGRAASEVTGMSLTGYDVFEAHLSNDPEATAIVNRSAAAVAEAIADVRSLLGIELVTIGGSVGLAEGYISMVRSHLHKEPSLFRPRVIAARLGPDSALFGVTIPRH